MSMCPRCGGPFRPRFNEHRCVDCMRDEAMARFKEFRRPSKIPVDCDTQDYFVSTLLEAKGFSFDASHRRRW